MIPIRNPEGMVSDMNSQPVRSRRLSDGAENHIRERHMQRQKKRRRRIMINRSILLIATVSVLLLIVMFLTPIFDVRTVNIEGNKRISGEILREYLADVPGENLFRVSDSYLEKKLSAISYIKNVEIEKKYFPAVVNVLIEEKIPCAYFENDGKFDIIDSEAAVLESRESSPEDIPELITYFENPSQFLKDEEAVAELQEFFNIAVKIGIESKITAVNLLDFNEIEFEYEGRLNVVCGSGIDMEQKLRLFKASVNNPGISKNAHGTMDLSTVGKARYKP